MNLKHPLCFLLFCGCFTTILNAQEGNCVVSTKTGHDYHLAFDNKFQNDKAAQNVKITGIPEGDYWITILFHDTGKKAVKTHIRILGNKELTYDLVEYKGAWKLNIASTVAKTSVQTLNTSQLVLPYNKAGVEVKGIKDATEIDENMVHTKTEINRVQGDRKDAQGNRMGTHTGKTTSTSNPEDKRMGNYSSGTSGTNPDGTLPAQPAPTDENNKEGTFVVSKYIEIENADGTSSIVEERVTTIKDIVDRNGQKQLRSRKATQQIPTNFTCIPMLKDDFIALKTSIQNAEEAARLKMAEDGVKSQCMTPKQIKTIGDMILDEEERNTFAITAKPVCADPHKFPYLIRKPKPKEEVEVVAEETKKEAEVEKIIEEPKTSAQLKAELKALKLKEKLAKKLAKDKAKLEKAEAKRKAKEEKAAAKAAAKKKKEEEKKSAKD